MTARDTENRFLGSLLGLAIGDAMGMPVETLPVDETRREFGEITGYLPRNKGAEDEIPEGEITNETETALCIIESMTTNNGQIDAENINARLMFLANGPSSHWMPHDLRDGILAAADNDGMVPDDFERPASLAAGVMGVPVGLMHSVGGFDEHAFREDCRLVCRLTNAGSDQLALTTRIAASIARIVRDESIDISVEFGNEVRDLLDMVDAVRREVGNASSFEDVVLNAVNTRRPADSHGALAGVLAGARFGTSGIPQELIDELGARVYLTLAAPWFYRTATRRAGLVIDLREM